MIDLHCHMLPGIDDGAKTIEDSLALARASVDNGITHTVVTPHVYPGRWDNKISRIRPVFESLRQRLKEEEIPLTISLGGEVHLMVESINLLHQDEMPFIGGWDDQRVLLLELHDAHVPVGAVKAAEFLRSKQIVPMIAHPERNKDVMRDIRKIKPFLDIGCQLQLTAASVCGWFGEPAHRAALEILDAGWVFTIATDAHNMRSRPPVLAEARDVVEQRFGREASMILTQLNANRVVQGRESLGLDT